jgi:hypothetical protein
MFIHCNPDIVFILIRSFGSLDKPWIPLKLYNISYENTNELIVICQEVFDKEGQGLLNELFKEEQ